MTKKYEDYLKTDYWKEVSRLVKKRAGFKCQMCNSPHDLAAHHRTYEHRGSEMDHLDDLICLCRRCHAIFHGKEEAERPKKTKRQKEGHGIVDMAYVEANMPQGDAPVSLTKPLIDSCRANGAFTNATIRAFGLKSPLIEGWPGRLIGTEISRDQFRKALEGKFIYASGPLDRA